MQHARDRQAECLDYRLKRKEADTGASLAVTTTTILVAAAGTAKTVIASTVADTLDGDYRGSLWRTNAGAKACLSRDFFVIVDSTQD